MDGRIEREAVLPVPVDEAWSAIALPERLGAWFGARVELDLRPGGRAVFQFPDGTERRAVVEEVEPSRRLAFRWAPFERRADGSTVRVPSSRVELLLEETSAGARLTVVESLFPAASLAGVARRAEVLA